MFKVISYYWYTLKATIIIGYILFKVWENLTGIQVFRKDKIRIKLIFVRIVNFFVVRTCRCIPLLNNYAITLRIRDNLYRVARNYMFQFKHASKMHACITGRLREFYLAARCLIKFIRDSKKFNCAYMRASWAAQESRAALGTYIPGLIGMIWICEKMGMDFKLIYTMPNDPRGYIPDFFENRVLYPHLCLSENFAQIKTNIEHLEEINFDLMGAMLEFASHNLSSEYGHKVISMLTIKQEYRQQADAWHHKNIKGRCIGVHYRGTDVVVDISRKIKIDAYISYLKRVLDEESYIFACSDQAQFIGQINSAFPNRVIARDIKRSYTDEILHYRGCQQQPKDALIDMLILAKTELIYTVGSRFIDCIRFFNPTIKIISLEDKYQGKIGSKYPNYLPVPEEHYVRQIRGEAVEEWNTPPYF